MIKTTALVVLVIQIITEPVLETPGDWIRELILFVAAVTLGTGAKLAYRARGRAVVTRREVFISFVLGLTVGAIAYRLMDFYSVNAPRFVIVCIVSIGSELIGMWVNERGKKILDKIFKKGTGIDLEGNGQDNFREDSDSTP